MLFRRLLPLAVCSLALAPAALTADAARAEDALDFNRDIRPILSENCFYCHGQDGNKRQADLRLDVRDVAVDHGALVPGDAGASELVQRIRSNDADLLMPPPDSNRRLSDQQKAMLERWIGEGAAYADHWAYVAPVRPPLPPVERTEWVRSPIDLFVLARLEAAGLQPSPEADRATLIRRLSFDLIGLPPTPAEVDAFLADERPGAYERLVDRLLASPHYGERMALAWLDAARYADSNGFQQDGDTWQWLWRDWVVRALNEDLPFDQFTIWQLAGDLLPDATIDQRIASGFNRNHLLNGEGGAIPEEQRFVILFDRIDTTATTWLGLTMACAQCHDHKYDPLTQRDYYRMLDGFNRLPESGTPQFFSSRIRLAPPLLELPTAENQARIAQFEARIAEADIKARELADAAYAGWREAVRGAGAAIDGLGLPDELATIARKAEGERTDDERARLESGLRKHFDDKVRAALAGKLPPVQQLEDLKKQLAAYRADQIPRVMIMSDERPRETHVLERGEYLKPLEKVAFGTPEFLPPLAADAPPNRLGLARWLVAPEHPLTARVQVNRIWQHFFGAGIVKTSEDFGVQSEYPLHRELLDWLAVEFQHRGWSVKTMHRLVVTSATYRQSSRATPERLASDGENRFVWRSSRFRLPAMLLRDTALASSGLLDRRIGGQPVYPYQPDDVWEPLAITKERDFTYPASKGRDLYRRSLYTFWRRTVSPANMFDASNRQTCRVRLATTSTPLHALTTLNDPTWVEAARVLAEQGLRSADDLDGRLTYVWRRVLGRTPAPRDLELLRRSYEKQLAVFAAEPAAAAEFLSVGAAARDPSLDAATHAALTAVCLAILNLDEAVTRE
ncbi:MAG: PSD1 domain-containing protein [Pirellulaceae bacterium]|nr:PSD1 domain-containing protein [Pirellulaceae bacterium]